jgi:hypothetical protein
VRLLPQADDGRPASCDAWDGRWGVPGSSLFPAPRTPSFQARYQHPFAASTTRRRSFTGGAAT